MAATIAQTIAIVDRSGKVVSSSKQLKDVFFEAKLAYQERKAEIKAERKRKEDRELQKAIKAMSIANDDNRSEVSRSSSRHHGESRRRRESSDRHSRQGDQLERRYSATNSPRPRSHRSGSNSPRSPGGTPNLAQFNNDLYGTHNPPRSQSRSVPVSPVDEPNSQLIRRSLTDNNVGLQQQQRSQPIRSYSATDVDLDLAYGEFHAPDLNPTLQQQPTITPERELSSLVTKCQSLLDEADCATYSVKKIIVHLQSNPDAMAAVALTLAEISNIASKMAPGALMAFKSSAPAVMALLAAPEFLIAVGVGVGITVVCFGGYKIIKKIKDARANAGQENAITGGAARGGSVDEMIDVKELDRIEAWRRGISDPRLLEGNPAAADDVGSVVSGYSATSVEGEFISPFAQRSMGHLPLPAKSSKSKDKERDKAAKKEKKEKDKEKKQKKKRDNEGDAISEIGSETSNGTKGSARDKMLIRVKKPSPLRRMFSATTASSTRS